MDLYRHSDAKEPGMAPGPLTRASTAMTPAGMWLKRKTRTHTKSPQMRR